MATLTRTLLAQGKFNADTAAPSAKKPVGILQIGDGNFLRGFADWMVDIANGAGLMNGEVTVAQPLPQGIADLLNAQDGLYTVLLRGVQNGKPVDSRRVVSCVKRALDPYAQWDAMLAIAKDPALRFVISNTTEAGIAYAEEAYVEGQCPTSFPAKVAALLLARYRALGGGSAPGLVFLPCELIEANGAKLAACVLQLRRRLETPRRVRGMDEIDQRVLQHAGRPHRAGVPRRRGGSAVRETGLHRPAAGRGRAFSSVGHRSAGGHRRRIPAAQGRASTSSGRTTSRPTARARCASSTARTRPVRWRPSARDSTPSSR